MSCSRTLIVATVAAGLSLVLAGCSSAPRFTEARQLGDQLVSAETLQQGYEAYTLNCQACHGELGDGNGPASAGLRPPPRDFRQAVFKFGWVVDGLPHDDDIKRIVSGGLHGTPMLQWDIREPELTAVVQYLKTFSPEWQEPDVLGERVVASADPWGAARRDEAIARGSKIYHGLATCQSCHPAYETRQGIFAASSEVGNQPITEFRDNLYFSEAKESDYAVNGHPIKIMPPDFLFSSVRAGATVEALYSTIGSGIPGTAMPAWKGALPEEDLWALAHYVGHLIQLKDTPDGKALKQQLASQPPFVPPAPEEPILPTGA